MIRNISPGDESPLARFFGDNDRPEIVRYFKPFPLNADSARGIAQEPGRDLYLAYWTDDSIIGMAMLRGWNQGYDVPSFGVIVDYRHRGRGVGQALLKHALSEARQLGCQSVRLTVFESNSAAHRWYERVGFRTIARTPGPDGDTRLTMLLEFAHE